MKTKSPSKISFSHYDHLICGIVVSAPSGQIIYSNKAAKQILNLKSIDGSLKKVFPTIIEKIDAGNDSLQNEEIEWKGQFLSVSVSKDALGTVFSFVSKEGDSLHQSEQRNKRIKSLFERAPVAMQIFDTNGDLVEVNTYWEELWGIKAKDAIGWYNLKKDKAILDGGFLKDFEKALSGKAGVNRTLRFSSATLPGESRWISVRYFPILDDHDKTENIVVFNEDVTERFETQKKIVESEEKFKAVVENLSGVTYMIEPDPYKMLFVNSSVKAITGYSPKSLMEGRVNLLDKIHPNDTTEKKPDWDRGIQAGEKVTVEYRLKTKRGKWIWIQDTGQGVFDDKGNLKYTVGYFEDISESKQAFESLQLNEKRLKALFDNAANGIGVIDSKGRLKEVNQRFCDILGYSRKELTAGMTMQDLTVKEDIKENLTLLRRLLSGKISTYQLEKRYRTKKGEIVFGRISVSKYFDPQSEDWRLVGSLEDISEMKSAQEEVQYNEKKFRSLYEHAGHGIALANADGILIEVNAQAAKMLGYKKGELEGKSVNSITYEEDVTGTKQRLSDFNSGKIKRSSIEKRYVKKDGTLIWVSVSTSTFKDPKTNKPVLIGIIQDITHTKEVIQKIRESELKFRSVFEEAGHGVIITDNKANFLNANRKYRQMFGLLKADMESNFNPRDIIHEDSLPKADELLEKISSNPSKSYEQVLRFKHPTGKSLFVRVNVSAYNEPKSQETRIVSILEDITKRTEVLHQLQQSEEYQFETINALTLGLMAMNSSGKILRTNKSWDKITSQFKHWSNAKLNRNFLKILEKYNQNIALNGINAVQTETSPSFEMELQLSPKSDAWFLLRASKLKDKFDNIIITLQEITVRKKVEKALEESLSNYRNIYNLTPVMMHSISPDGKLMSVSNFWLEKLGYKRHEVIGRNIRDFLTEESKKDADIILPIFFEKGSIFDVSYQFITKSGEVLETILSAIEEGKGTKNARSLAVVSDITELKSTEKELKSSREELKLTVKELEKSLEEKDILVKEVHHRVKNNMQMISSILSLKSLDLTDPMSKEIFDECTLRIKSMAVVHDQLYRFYNVSEIEIADYLDHLLSGLNALMAGSGGDFRINIKSDEYKMSVDIALLCGLIISEIVANAFKHGFNDLPTGEVNVLFEANENQLTLSVTNTGHPIPTNVLEHRTSSLGMSLIKTFASQLGGKIALHPDNGFKLNFQV